MKRKPEERIANRVSRSFVFIFANSSSLHKNLWSSIDFKSQHPPHICNNKQHNIIVNTIVSRTISQSWIKSQRRRRRIYSKLYSIHLWNSRRCNTVEGGTGATPMRNEIVAELSQLYEGWRMRWASCWSRRWCLRWCVAWFDRRRRKRSRANA